MKFRHYSVIQKSQNFKGFGDPTVSQISHWYEIEYLEGEDLIELHWLKIADPCKAEKQKLRQNMIESGFYVDGAGETDFLALIHLGLTEYPKNSDLALLYRATKRHQSNTIKLAIAEIGKDVIVDNLYLKTLHLKYCQVTDVIVGEKVTLSYRGGHCVT
jgi:hypothetical protein